MEMTFTCDCGHDNRWPILSNKISNFICEKCGKFIGACNSREVRFSNFVRCDITYDYNNGVVSVRRIPERSSNGYYYGSFLSTNSTSTSDYFVDASYCNSTW